ncbi:hypothetical protein CHS0354_009103 [Potamilus streckersoni]|uniref:Protein kinase domain-containing protein n=1 Tax=Potamilus streckersoni TaxID=2493646 RepID=A0AAE0TIK1_9BIVA|nr:hypothetical protein CHS0354_009103 [Potamilus streckersoni]
MEIQGRRGSIVINNVDDIIKIPDLRSAFAVMKELCIPTTNLSNLDEAKKRIIDHFEKSKGPIRIAPGGEKLEGLKKAVEEDKENRTALKQKYSQSYEFFKQLPRQFQMDLNQVFTDIDKQFQDRPAELSKNECTILIAGETTAGKSSLINLLLGFDLLPTSQLSCTATMCEIRSDKSGIKEASVYFRSSQQDSGKKSRKAPERLNISESKGQQLLRQYLTQVDEYGESPIERIEVFWPFSMLEDGIVIVDTPGIGGAGKMMKYVGRYLEKSFGSIYVINSTNAGGVQKGRLQDFLRTVVNSAGEDFNPDAALFIVNKWDQIPEIDQPTLQEDIWKKLSKLYPGLKEDQLCYISLKDAAQAIQYGTQTADHKQMSSAISSLLPDSLRNRLNSHYRWISSVLKRSAYSLKVSRVLASKNKDKVQEKFETIQKQMNLIERNAGESLINLRQSMDVEVELICRKVEEALKSPELNRKLFEWNPKECPSSKDVKKLCKQLEEKLAERVATVLNSWERSNNIVADIKNKIIRVFKRDFELMEDQITKCEGALLDGENRVITDLHKSIKKQAPVKQLFKKAKTNAVDEDLSSVKGLGAAVCSAGRLDISKNREVKNLMKNSKISPENRVCEAMTLYISSIFQNRELKMKVHRYFSKFMKGVDSIAKMIPDFLKADRQMIKTLSQEMLEYDQNLKDVFPTLIPKCYTLQGQLDLFFVNHIMKFDYKLEDLSWDMHEAPIGSGSFADVYLAHIKGGKRSDRRELPVALKVCRDPIKENTVTDILLEDRTLRDLDHDNIVKYYGATFKYRNTSQKKDVQWIMILEMCKDTLKSTFIGPEVENPGKMSSGSRHQLRAMKEMASYVIQICKGLKYLHDKGFVHRDIKLENILVGENKVVKLTDVGLAKPMVDIAHSIVGSPVYMAPEVLLQFERNYDSQADIYSLAIVLWEMWYGMDAADHIQQQLFRSLEESIKSGLRPSMSQSVKPPDNWAALIKASWEYEAYKRPDITEHIRFFDDFLRNN